MRFMTLVSIVVAGGMLGGCAGDGTSALTTGAVPQNPQVAAAPVDPACLALQNRIALLREEGTVGRVEQAAAGKTKTVVIKRSALSKVAEFNKANAEFRARCSKLPQVASQPATTTQSVAAQTAASAAAAAQSTAATVQAGRTAAAQTQAAVAAVKRQ
jgi:hypothetical protein